MPLEEMMAGLASSAMSVYNNERQLQFGEESRENQNYMANSSYQRSVHDLKMAGLNPMLAYHNGGAPTGSPVASPNLSNPVEAGVATASKAAELRNANAQGDVLKAQADNIRADTALKGTQVPYFSGLTAQSAASTRKTDEEVSNVVAERERIAAEIRRLNREYEGIDAENERKKFYVREIAPMESALRRTEYYLKAYELPEARNRAAMHETEYGRVRPYLQDLGSGISSAGKAAVGVRGTGISPIVTKRVFK